MPHTDAASRGRDAWSALRRCGATTPLRRRSLQSERSLCASLRRDAHPAVISENTLPKPRDVRCRRSTPLARFASCILKNLSTLDGPSAASPPVLC
jgi:hypothetical protein